MVEEALHAARIGGGIGETMAGAAVELQPPVHVPAAFISASKSARCSGGMMRIVGADADQDLALDIGGVLRPGGGEAGMEADDGLDVGAAAADSSAVVPPKQ